MDELNDNAKFDWEIINPSDPYVIHGTERIAGYVVLLAGKGQFGINRPGDDDSHGIGSLMAFASDLEAKEVIDNILRGLSVNEFWLQHADEMIEACESVFLGSVAERDAWEMAMSHVSDTSERAAALESLHDSKRSSMNDIGGVIRGLGRRIAKFRDDSIAEAG